MHHRIFPRIHFIQIDLNNYKKISSKTDIQISLLDQLISSRFQIMVHRWFPKETFSLSLLDNLEIVEYFDKEICEYSLK